MRRADGSVIPDQKDTVHGSLTGPRGIDVRSMRMRNRHALALTLATAATLAAAPASYPAAAATPANPPLRRPIARSSPRS